MCICVSKGGFWCRCVRQTGGADGLRDSLCSLFAYIWQPSVLIGLRDVSIRLDATLFCLRTAALYQHCAHVHWLYATHQLMPPSEWKLTEMLWFGGTKTSAKHMGSKLKSNCIFRRCLRQLVIPDKLCFSSWENTGHKKVKKSGISYLKTHLSIIIKKNNSCRNNENIPSIYKNVYYKKLRAFSNTVYYGAHAMSAVTLKHTHTHTIALHLPVGKKNP